MCSHFRTSVPCSSKPFDADFKRVADIQRYPSAISSTGVSFPADVRRHGSATHYPFRLRPVQRDPPASSTKVNSSRVDCARLRRWSPLRCRHPKCRLASSLAANFGSRQPSLSLPRTRTLPGNLQSAAYRLRCSRPVPPELPHSARRCGDKVQGAFFPQVGNRAPMTGRSSVRRREATTLRETSCRARSDRNSRSWDVVRATGSHSISTTSPFFNDGSTSSISWAKGTWAASTGARAHQTATALS